MSILPNASNLQIQCKPYQNTNDIFFLTEAEQKIF